MSPPKFIHLRTHSSYSLLEGAIAPKAIIARAKAENMPAVAITDTNNLFCALEFSEAAAEAGIQPIIGIQLALNDLAASSESTRPQKTPPLILLAQNEIGYLNLAKLSSIAHLMADLITPSVTSHQLISHAEGLICLTGGANGALAMPIQEGRIDAAMSFLTLLKTHFPERLYIEINRHGKSEDIKTEKAMIDLAYAEDLPLVATNDVHFLNQEMYDAHDAFLCIADGTYVDQQEPRRRLTDNHYFKSAEEMSVLFADIPEALSNSVEIARRCAFRVKKRDPILPRFAANEVEELRRQAQSGLEARLASIEPAASRETYQTRLEFELGVIEEMGFPGYFLIVADFIQWAKAKDIPVGPGRGSGAGSLVAYALTITDLDPIRYSLLFERFLNPERISMPDFDIDFCMERREEVIQYVQEKYGRDRVAQIITFGALLSKAAVRDVGRVLQMPYGQVDRLAKLIPLEGMKPVSIEKALADEPRLREEARSEGVVTRLLDYAQSLEGLLRNASTHAAGVVIGDRPLEELVPLYKDPRSDMPATQFNMKWVEEAGLVKFDFLGLKTLTVIQGALDLLKTRDIAIDINQIDLADEKTYALYSSAKTVAVFQVESTGMMDALRRMKPNCIEDIIALVALYRPGPMENIPQYCDVKNGRAARESIDPLIDHILDETQGIIVYQEQVMQIAQVMAGYSLGGADKLRRAMGKKIQSAMDAQKPIFIEGAQQNGVGKDKASEVWDLLDKFANYGFNKSHAAAYALVSYQTAYLKANYPVEFMASVMNCDLHLTDKLNVYVQEVRRLGIKIIPPCVNRSFAKFGVKDGTILYALGGLKNVGLEVMELIIDARQDRPFENLIDFASRVDLKKIGKRPLEMLARAGAFDQIEGKRGKVFAAVDALIAFSSAIFSERNSAQEGLFSHAGEELPPPRILETKDWPMHERLSEEHQALGFYLSGHPLDDYSAALRRKGVLTFRELEQKLRDGSCDARIAGAVAKKQERKSARGNRFAFVTLSDATGFFELTVFSEALEKYRALLEPGQNIVATVEAALEGEQSRLLVRHIADVERVAEDHQKRGMRIFVGEEEALPAIKARFEEAHKESAMPQGAGPVQLMLTHPELPGTVEMNLNALYPINRHIKAAIKHIPGVLDIEEI